MTALVAASCSADVGTPGPQPGPSRGSSPAAIQEAARVQQYVDSIYAPTDIRHSFRTPFGEDIDCIDFNAQPSVKAALQQGIALRDEGPPVSPPQLSAPVTNPLRHVTFDGEPDEAGNPRRCPSGSVPYVRPSIDRVQRAGGLDAFLSRRTRPPLAPPASHPPPFTTGYDHAVGAQTVTNYGGNATLSVYNPWVYLPYGQGAVACGGYGQPFCDHSLAQIWTYTGSCVRGANGTACPSGTSPVQSVEVGWTVDFGVYLDGYTHLFVYMTNDGYWQSGCYSTAAGTPTAASNPPCGFSAISGAQYAPNQIIASNSAPGQPGLAPPEMAVLTFNPGGSNANWYIAINGNWIGYVAGGLYNGGQMTTSAARFQVGGEIFDESEYQTPQSYDQTCMGGCYNPTTPYGGVNRGYGWAAYAHNLYYLVPGFGFQQCQGSPCCSNGWCFTPPSLTSSVNGFAASQFGYSTSLPVGSSDSGNWGPYFYFGGGR